MQYLYIQRRGCVSVCDLPCIFCPEKDEVVRSAGDAALAASMSGSWGWSVLCIRKLKDSSITLTYPTLWQDNVALIAELEALVGNSIFGS